MPSSPPRYSSVNVATEMQPVRFTVQSFGCVLLLFLAPIISILELKAPCYRSFLRIFESAGYTTYTAKSYSLLFIEFP